MNHPNHLRRIFAASLIAVCSHPGSADAAVFIPYGVQQNVLFTTVTETWGWTLVYQGTYSETVGIDELYDGVFQNDYIMYAARPVGSPTITLLAAADEADVRTVTAPNQTTPSNGAEWYYNDRSLGFAGEGLLILQNTADTNEAGGGPTAETRLSWHTSGDGDSSAPVEVNGGWRAGATTGLNFSNSWERLVFVATPIPEPSSALMLGVAALAVSTRRRRSH